MTAQLANRQYSKQTTTALGVPDGFGKRYFGIKYKS